MARSTFQRMLGIAGAFAVLAILGFVILPAAVVTLAAFNDKAISRFPADMVVAVVCQGHRL
jgi:putative spermidine/putrescine transport system permease protein